VSIAPCGWTTKGKCWRVVFVAAVTLVIGAWILRGRQQRAFAERTHCVGNLVQIALAKSLYQEDFGLAVGDPIPNNALDKYLPKPAGQFRCPSGATYLVRNVGITPKCTYTNVCYTYRFDWTKLRLERRAWTHSLEQSGSHGVPDKQQPSPWGHPARGVTS
jgi:hypothetical protein